VVQGSLSVGIYLLFVQNAQSEHAISEGFIAPVRKLVLGEVLFVQCRVILGILQEQSLAIHCANDSNDLKCSGSWPYCVS
jgi:hypothetical protein